MKTLSKIYGLMLLVLVSACSEELLNDQSDRQITINAVMPEYQTRAGLEQKNGSLDLIAKWKEDDEVYLFIEQNKKVYTVAPAKVRNISSDGKTCNIVLSVPSGVKAEEPYLIYGLCDIKGTVEKNKVYAESELKRVYWENSSQGFAPVWFKTTGGPMNFSVNFQHLGTYEVLHVKNESKIGISFRHFGFEVNTPWYKSFEKTSLDDPYTLVNNPSDFGDDANSRASHIGIGETVKFLSWYIPSGASVKDARLKATIDGKEYITTNKKSSDVEIQRGHAYHMYATWDGKELKFTNGDIEDELTLSETSIAIQLKEQKTVNITSGSGQYSVKSNNTSVATVSLSGTAITVKGVSKGSATITVTDTKTKQTATIEVLVIDNVEVDGQLFTVNGVSFMMVNVEGGDFTMGATSEQGSDSYSNEKPAHKVIISDFSIAQTEVTQELWQAVMGSNPSEMKDPKRPVENVSWEDCQKFIKKLNALTDTTFRLPTEAEWEYAARGGKKSANYKYAGGNDIDYVAWYRNNSSDETKTVSNRMPNELGLYDMSGNVSEWCQDWFGNYSGNTLTNPTGPDSGEERVIRGGSIGSGARYCRVSYRSSGEPDYLDYDIGLRLALTVPTTEPVYNYILHSPSPADGATGIDKFTFYCSNSSYNDWEREANYQFRISESPDMSNILGTVRIMHLNFGANFGGYISFKSKTTYYWQVSHFDFENGEYVIASPVWSFTTK